MISYLKMAKKDEAMDAGARKKIDAALAALARTNR